MRKKKILNICMVLTIIFSVVCGIMAVGSVKGWFSDETSSSDLIVSEKTGIAMIERSGVAYEVTAETPIKSADKLYTKTAASLIISKTNVPIIYIGKNTEISFLDVDEKINYEVLKGDTLIDARRLENSIVQSGTTEIALNKAVASVSTQAGSSMVYVYAGEVVLSDKAFGKSTPIPSGKVVTIVADAGEYEITDLSANNLSDIQMEQIRKCGMDDSFCFTENDLEKVQQERETEKLKAQQEAIKQKEEIKKETQENSETESSETTDTDTSNQDDTKNDTDVTDNTNNQQDSSEDTDSGENDEDEYVEPEKNPTCTIKIVCDTILDNKGNLTPGKEGYVPSSGTILGTTTVEFSDGETVFDVLQRVCDRTGIQIEYSYTPIYESYYIEGINHLYEFDCGPESGWMYKVNGWFPNYGCSSYYVQDGDTIVWCYTCNGLGADVGGSNF